MKSRFCIIMVLVFWLHLTLHTNKCKCNTLPFFFYFVSVFMVKYLGFGKNKNIFNDIYIELRFLIQVQLLGLH